MKRIYYSLFIALFVFACQQETEPVDKSTDQFTVGEQIDASWQKDKLSLYPVYASEAFVAKHERLAQYKVLGEALKNEKFRIVEHKPFGRFAGRDAVNRLTVENRSQDTVFLMSGDIIQGGRQDRVIAEDRVIASRQIKNVDVFCVEKGRSSFHHQSDEEINETAPVYAFRGYYNVAPKHLREEIRAGDQEGVWNAVAAITSEHEAVNSTSAYAGLEEASDYTRERDEYLEHFNALFKKTDQLLVGLVAVSGEQIIAADVFGHPSLAKARIPSLLPGYITEALTYGEQPNIEGARMPAIAAMLNRKYTKGDAYFFDGLMMHLSSL